MTIRTMLFTAAMMSPLALAAGALAAATQGGENPADPANEAMTETAEQKAARELCMEEADTGDYPGWSIRQGETCQNSYTNVCKIVRTADGAEASHTCYVPPPMPEAESDEPGSEAEQ